MATTAVSDELNNTILSQTSPRHHCQQVANHTSKVDQLPSNRALDLALHSISDRRPASGRDRHDLLMRM